MLRNSGYTRSASRPRAASSPPFQALSRFVISREDLSMDAPFSSWAPKKYTRNVAAFAVRLRLYQRKETSSQNDLLQKDKETTMKHIATVALMLNLGVAGVYA